MKSQTLIFLFVTLLCAEFPIRGQGTFQNLNFESAQIPANTPPSLLPISQAMPGWMGYANGNPLTSVLYNTISLSSAAISLQGPGSLEPVLQGNYSVFLQSSELGQVVTPAIAQTGAIPIGTQFIQFDSGFGGIAVFFARHPIALSLISVSPNYNVYVGNISPYAGQTGLLLFQGEGSLDNISFSSSPIPEPATCSLILGGVAIYAFARWKRVL